MGDEGNGNDVATASSGDEHDEDLESVNDVATSSTSAADADIGMVDGSVETKKETSDVTATSAATTAATAAAGEAAGGATTTSATGNEGEADREKNPKVPRASSVATPPVSGGLSTAVKKSAASGKVGGKMSAEDACKEMNRWIRHQGTSKLSSSDAETVQILLSDYAALKEKTIKLKSLLGRSAKAQRENKIELEQVTKKYDNAAKEIEKLYKKIDKLSNRPTHMELLADFETNFDKALLSVGQQQHEHQQAGGQETAQPANTAASSSGSSYGDSGIGSSMAGGAGGAVVDNLLLQELSDSKQRIEKLEHLNKTLVHRTSNAEQEAEKHQKEIDALLNKVSHVELEKRMAQMEMEHTRRLVDEKAASIEEMQMEIDLITKASVNANARAAQSDAYRKHMISDQQHVQELEQQVEALQEWATASTQAKTLSQQRVKSLEQKLQRYEDRYGVLPSAAAAGSEGAVPGNSAAGTPKSSAVTASQPSSPSASSERLLFQKKGSLVIGAGDVGFHVVQFTDEHIKKLKKGGVSRDERIVLRWKFDLSSENLTIEYTVFKGVCDTPKKRRASSGDSILLLKQRTVQGGAGGEIDNPFLVQNACTMLWSNEKSWVRPRTVKYEVDVVALAD